MTTVDIDVVCWNVKGVPARLRDGQLALIDELAPDVLLLQELSPAAIGMLRQRGWSGMSALELLPDGHVGRANGRPVRFSCGVLTRGGWRVSGAATDADAPSPERWLTAQVERDGVAFDVGSFACPPGVGWGAMKAEQGRRIAAWMASRQGATVVGIDRNGPRHEQADGSIEPWPHDAGELVGPDPAHPCRDALVDLHQREHDRARRALAERPDGPLEVSYVRGHAGQRQTHCRYDALYVSEHVAVRDVRYLYDASVAAGSDHAAIAARLAPAT